MALRMSGLIRHLEWDSEFFGVSIGQVDLDGVSGDDLALIDEEARDLNIECLYGTLSDPGVGDTAHLVQTYGHRLIEVGLRFRRPDVPFTPKPTKSTVRYGTLDDIEMLADPLDVLAPWSRFAADPRFGPEAARRMHHAWVVRAASEPHERMLAIAEDETGVTGIATHVRTPIPRVDLMGVITQGSGASWAMMNLLVEWAGGGEIEAGPCAARNIAPCRFLEHCGFSIAAVHYQFHRWLDEAQGMVR
jgi:hypothetical protein